jgi:ribosomal protein S5
VLGGQIECWAGVGWGACSGLGSSILKGCKLGFGELIAFTLGVQTLLEAVDSLEQGLEDVRLGPALLGHGIVDTRAVEDLAGLAGWTGAVALDLAGRSVV